MSELIDTQLLAAYALLVALDAEEEALRRRGRGGAILPAHSHPEYVKTTDADANYVNASGDTMTGALNIDELLEATTDAGVTLDGVKLKDGDVYLDTLGAGLTGIVHFATQLLFIESATSTTVFDFDTTVSPPAVTFAADFGNDLLPSLFAGSINVGSDAQKWAYGYFEKIQVGTTSASANITFDTDDKSDIGTAIKQARNAYIDGWAYIDSLRVDEDLNLDNIDIDATSVATVQGVIPITVEGTTRYIPFYESYA